MEVRTAFILGAGLGTRLRPFTEHCPKPLLPVAGRPLITYAMDHCLTLGVERFIVNTHYCAAAYDKAFPEGRWRGAPILFRHEPILLDTAGGLKNIEDLLEADETLLVYNGDILSDLPLAELLAGHRAQKRDVTLALRSDGSLKNVCLDSRGMICDIRDLLNRPGVRRCLFTGIYLVERRFFRRLTLGKAESVVPVFAAMIRETQDAVASVVIDAGGWEDIGDPEAYSRIVASIAGDDQEAAAFVREALELAAGKEVRLAPIGKGGSDRDYYRVGAQGKPTVLMRYGRLYEENDRYAALSGFLLGIDVMVPMIYCHDPQRRLILMEDLGDEDLYTLREAPWAQRRSFYEKTLLQAVRLHTFPLYRIPSDLKLMAGFDSSLYRWERDYFLEECVRSACGIALRPGEAEDLEAELATLAERLLAMPQALIHRDLQSQNVMIRRGEPILIDFQGMRYGNPFYDLGSLLWDPYVAFPEGARETLLRFYYGAAGATISWEAFQKHFCLASIQRLMQALGAYGCLGLKRGKPHFLAHIDPALVNLAAVAAEAGGLPRLAALVARCRAAHRHS